MKRILVIFGTRPEAIKLLPVVKELKKENIFNVKICVTAQHREMLDQVLNIFNVVPDYDLNIMKSNQKLAELTANIIKKLDPILTIDKPDFIIVQGDTTTTFVASLLGFYHKTNILHVEAGLRTKDKYSPFPEEINRRLTSIIADYHFAPTKEAKNNLLKENVPEAKITVTGNTTIDSLFYIINKNKESRLNLSSLKGIDFNKDFVLITGHRRENFGQGFLNICNAINELSLEHPDINFIYPVHLNPNVQTPVQKILKGKKNVFLVEPLGYEEFVYLMNKSKFIMTDSGGVQEEAPALGKPLIIMREKTERPEVIKNNAGILVGTDKNKIIKTVNLLIKDNTLYKKYSKKRYIYGEGKASKIIVEKIKQL